ncbi:cell division protein ZapD [Neisseria leonii]|uniref:cell division protein ZapD n=1 Tax=Neisseria leonii TaxID=2995413 RepID=UPI00237C47B0|nr:cell division protein ZapD [Neisseria sp. 3986]MDD9324805.1 cell division protein ZapD [Neisseria sp. 3986]
MIRFEHPLSERIRNFLRIEHLFNRFHDESGCPQSVWSHHLALFTLFEIMECAGRAELKLDILQELERQKRILQRQDTGETGCAALERIHSVTADLQAVQQKFGQHLRENEWLMAIKQRMLVPGGTSPLDLPSYYYWQQLPYEVRKADLQGWIAMLLPTCRAVRVLMDILRANAWKVASVAEKGNYHHASLAQNIHLLGIDVVPDYQALPEVSANKYFTHIRFVAASRESARGKLVECDVPFELVMCSFDPVME